MTNSTTFQKFLLRKNLNIHLRRYHDREGGSGKSETSEADAKRQRSDNYSCSFCHKAFLYAQDRDEHENTHRGVKGHKCHCGKEYSSKKALLCHQKFVHSGKAKDAFQCSVSPESEQTFKKLILISSFFHGDMRQGA